MGQGKRSRTGAALRAAGVSYVTRALNILISFGVTPIVLGYIGRELYGFWAIVGSVVGYVSMVDFGITGSVATLIARDQRSNHSVNRIAANALVALTVAGILAVCAAVLASFIAPSLLRIEGPDRALVSKLILLAGLGLGLSFPPRALKAALRGTQHIATLNTAEFGLGLGRIGLMLGLLAAGRGVFALPWSTIAASIAALIVFWFLTRSRIESFCPTLSSVSSEQLWHILGISAWWFLGSLGALFIYQTDNIILGRYLGATAVTVYVLTGKIPNLIRGQLYQLNLALAPGIGDMVGHGEKERLQKLFLSMMRVTLFLGLTFGALVVVLNKDIVTLWVGAENYGGYLLTVLFAATMAYLVTFHFSSIILTNHLDLKVLAGTRFLEGLVNLALSLLLVGKWGMLGVAAATLVAGLLTSGWFLPLRAAKKIGLPLRKLFREVVTRGFMFGLVVVVAIVGLSDFRAPSWAGVLCLGGTMVILLIVSGWVIVLPRGEILARLGDIPN